MLKQNMYVLCRKEIWCCVIIFGNKIALIYIIIYKKYKTDKIYKSLAAEQKIEINRRKFCRIFQDFKFLVFQLVCVVHTIFSFLLVKSLVRLETTMQVVF